MDVSIKTIMNKNKNLDERYISAGNIIKNLMII